MGKKKSVVFITLITILLVAFLFFSFVPFPINAVSKFKGFLTSAQLGMELGGGVETVYYPDGVISKAEFERLPKAGTATPNIDSSTPTQDDYAAYKGIYIEKSYYTNGVINANFAENFEHAFNVIQKRFEKKLYSNFSISKQDDFTILVRVPTTGESSSSLFNMMKANGGIKFLGAENTTSDYYTNSDASFIRSASVYDAGDTGYGIRINLTDAGRAKIKELTAGASSGNNNNGVTNVGGSNSGAKTVYIYIGTTQLLSVQASEEIDSSILAVSGRFSTKESANTVAALINLAKDENNKFRMSFENPNINIFEATMGQYTALILLLIVVAAFLTAIIYIFARYKGLGFVFLLSIVTFISAIILCTTFIPVLVITPTSFIALLFAGLLMTTFTKLSFDRIKTEFKKGKTLGKSIRDAFNKLAFITAEVHGALFVFATLFYAISTGMMQSVSLLFMIAIGLSAVVTLGLNRFYLYLTMPQAKNKIAYCNLRKEVIDLDDDE